MSYRPISLGGELPVPLEDLSAATLEVVDYNAARLESPEFGTILADESIGGNAGHLDANGHQYVMAAVNGMAAITSGRIEALGNDIWGDPELYPTSQYTRVCFKIGYQVMPRSVSSIALAERGIMEVLAESPLSDHAAHALLGSAMLYNRQYEQPADQAA